MRISIYFLFAFIALGTTLPARGGEKYTEAGNALGVEITQELIRKKLCVDAANCQKLIQIYGGHGDRVNFSAYGIGEKNRDALSVVVEVIVRRGLLVTNGVPISLRAYARPHEDYVNLGFFRSKDPILTLEVNK